MVWRDNNLRDHILLGRNNYPDKFLLPKLNLYYNCCGAIATKYYTTHGGSYSSKSTHAQCNNSNWCSSSSNDNKEHVVYFDISAQWAQPFNAWSDMVKIMTWSVQIKWEQTKCVSLCHLWVSANWGLFLPIFDCSCSFCGHDLSKKNGK